MHLIIKSLWTDFFYFLYESALEALVSLVKSTQLLGIFNLCKNSHSTFQNLVS